MYNFIGLAKYRPISSSGKATVAYIKTLRKDKPRT